MSNQYVYLEDGEVLYIMYRTNDGVRVDKLTTSDLHLGLPAVPHERICQNQVANFTSEGEPLLEAFRRSNEGWAI